MVSGDPEAGRESVVECSAPAGARKRKPVTARTDTYVDRLDLGRGVSSPFRKDDQVPPQLVDFLVGGPRLR